MAAASGYTTSPILREYYEHAKVEADAIPSTELVEEISDPYRGFERPYGI